MIDGVSSNDRKGCRRAKRRLDQLHRRCSLGWRRNSHGRGAPLVGARLVVTKIPAHGVARTAQVPRDRRHPFAPAGPNSYLHLLLGQHQWSTSRWLHPGWQFNFGAVSQSCTCGNSKAGVPGRDRSQRISDRCRRCASRIGADGQRPRTAPLAWIDRERRRGRSCRDADSGTL